MNRALEAILLLLVLTLCAGLTIGLTYAPCYSSLCSEDFFPLPTRFHCAEYYGLLASIGSVLLLRAYSPLCRSFSNYYIIQRRLPVLGKRVSVGGLALTVWIIAITAASSGFWVGPELAFWGLRTNPLHWTDAQVRLTITGVTGHHADILLGLVLIPVGRNSIPGRVFELHQSTLLCAHKLIAYLFFIAVLAHGAATYTFVATYGAAKNDSPKKDAFNIDNPTLTAKETEIRGSYHSATLGTGMISFLLIVVIVITSLPSLRRRAYNTFYYTHVICSALIFISASIHASTDFYFLLPGLLLWVLEWVWRLFRGDTGIQKRVAGKLEDAGNGWYRISLPVSGRSLQMVESAESGIDFREQANHPLQSYYINVPSISKLQSHAFTAAKTGSIESGPVFLFQRAQGIGGKNESKLAKEWTWKAGCLAQNSDGTNLPQGSRQLDVRVEGPYIPTEVGFRNADQVICIVGGTGITGAHSLAHWWLAHRLGERNAHFTLIWTIRYRDTSRLREWLELKERIGGAGCNVQLKVHVSSENGRIDVMQLLRDAFAYSDEKEAICAQKAWVYVSGPASLLNAAEDACVDLERELKKLRIAKRQVGLTINELQHYVAKWEV